MPSPKPPITIRRPATTPPAADVERFVSAGQDVPGTECEGPGTPVPGSLGKGIHQRKNGRKRRRITAYIPPDLAQLLFVRSATTGRQASDIVTDALKAHLSSTEPTTRKE